VTSVAAPLVHRLRNAPLAVRLGEVRAFNGLVVEAAGPDARLGEICQIDGGDGRVCDLQVVGFRDQHVILMPYGRIDGLGAGTKIRATGRMQRVQVGPGLLGRVVDAFCAPLDGGAPIEYAADYPLYREPINPLARAPIDTVLETGIRAVDGLLTMGEGQRVGIFAGSGVGKSTLLGMLARQVSADVTVLALIGERGREVGDFLQDVLGEAGLRRAVVIVATADESPLVRTHAAHAAHAVAEYFRDRGDRVLLVVDSMTRFAMAQREIGLATGEPPTFRGYTPSVFGQLPRLLERCGRMRSGGVISGIYSVLVEGDDMNEPVADHMRSILDGHIVLTRELGARAHYPAIDVLQSASRVIGQVASRAEAQLAMEARKQLAVYEASRDLIELGAYQKGANAALDHAVSVVPKIEEVLQQASHERSGRADALGRLAAALGKAAA
jgi:flagellum-specific ATP synthase